MTILTIPDQDKQISIVDEIKNFVSQRGILFERWEASTPLSEDDDQETILKAYEHKLKPYMKENGFQSADVINVHPKIEGIKDIRKKFLKEHTHSEDEVRFFVDGEGLFWFNIEEEKLVFSLKLERGDFISVPANYKHWFDLAPKYFVKAIRVFSNKEGWVANYTGSGLDEKYNKI